MSGTVWVLMGGSLAIIFGIYMGSSVQYSEVMRPTVSPWNYSGPSWAAELVPGPDGPVANGTRPSADGGMFRVRFPFNSTAWHTVHVRLLNESDVLDSYENFAICVGAAPAQEEDGSLIKDHDLFLQHARTWSITHPACSLIVPENGRAEFDLDPLYGIAVDSGDRSMSNPGASDPAWRVIDIGVVESGFQTRAGVIGVPFRLHLSVEPN